MKKISNRDRLEARQSGAQTEMLWNRFKTSGRIDDYMAYSCSKNERQEQVDPME